MGVLRGALFLQRQEWVPLIFAQTEHLTVWAPSHRGGGGVCCFSSLKVFVSPLKVPGSAPAETLQFISKIYKYKLLVISFVIHLLDSERLTNMTFVKQCQKI